MKDRRAARSATATRRPEALETSRRANRPLDCTSTPNGDEVSIWLIIHAPKTSGIDFTIPFLSSSTRTGARQLDVTASQAPGPRHGLEVFRASDHCNSRQSFRRGPMPTDMTCPPRFPGGPYKSKGGHIWARYQTQSMPGPGPDRAIGRLNWHRCSAALIASHDTSILKA